MTQSPDAEVVLPAATAAGDGVVLRAATTADLAALDRLPGLSASTRRGLARQLARATADARGDTVVVVATRAGVLLGAALGLLQVDDGHVVDLAVAPTARRSGTGRALLGALTDELRTRGARAITLEVRAGNLPALALYRGEGFEVEGRRPGYYPDGEDALLLWQRGRGGTRDGGTHRDHPDATARDIVTGGG